ncbi:hypothetical protein COCON_G00025410 [Conger conger]|uniref:AAA+ ATPase domain-containing protein n=1 Tax=Conger conger TaxID=82655 RepID=A0A9Q1DXM2_CONCO|nr:hypothetical protein COCON_G00025410 [Conger conger]
MNAFKQASLDSGRGKAKKGPGKPGEAGEEAQPEEEERQEERQEEDKPEEQGQDAPAIPEMEQEKPAGAGQTRGGRLGKRGRRRGGGEAAAPVPAAAAEETLPLQAAAAEETPPLQAAAAEETPPLQAGKEDVGEGATDALPSTPAGRGPVRSREPGEVEGSGGAAGRSAEPGTPRARVPKRSVYRAEMISSPDDKGSPIRMRLRRVLPNSEQSGAASDFEILSPLAVQKPSLSKNRKQKAKKLVQKARVLQQNKKAAANVGTKDPVKRRLRTRDVPKSYCEDEDSVMCLSDVQKSPAPAAKDKASGQKQLRSLNDVLGRNAAENKAGKSTTAPKAAALLLGKKPQKPSAVISIFDDSSRDGSENSQDSEPFRARREFLKSGLPDSFKKQIARTTASHEAYSLASASFSAVLHVLQRPPECPLWNLPWPVSPLLKRLSETCLQPPRPLLSLGALDCVKTEPAQRAHTDKGSGWRQDFPEEIRRRLLEEIRAANPPFPVRRFLAWFLRKRQEHLLQPASAEADRAPEAPVAPEVPELGGKRKRRQEGQAAGKLPKRRRSARGEQEPIVIEDDPPAACCPAQGPAGRARLSRARGASEPQQGADVQNASPVLLEDPSPAGGHSCVTWGHLSWPALVCTEGLCQECVKEDVLWTEKYQPQHSSEVIGNSAAVKKLRSWLEEWKQRADRDERRNRKEKKQEDNSNESWDCGDFRGEGDVEDGEELLCNTLLITGPPGVGKTAAVYACAQELGFKVFEVNASSQRSGRQILSQLKEATQSHQVDIQGVNVHKPAYFNSYGTGSIRPGFSPRKLNSPRKVVSSPRKPLHSPCRKPRRGALAPTSLASIFKNGNKTKGKSPCVQSEPLQNETGPQKPVRRKESVPKATEPPIKPSSDKTEPLTEEQSKKTATSLILFEEVDVIFDDDSGFLAAIKTFMATTKRPVILTTSDPTFSEMFDGNFEEIHFKTPSAVNVRSYLQLLCLAEGVRTDARDLSSLLCWNRCDVRQSLLHLQFWVRSAGGPGPDRPLPALEPAALAQGETESVEAAKPDDEEDPPASSTSCDSRCTESLLGILNIDGAQDLSDMLKCTFTAEPRSSRSRELLVESWGRGVDLLYSNMEELLPLPVCALQGALLSQQGAPKPQSAAPSEDCSPVKTSSRMQRRKRLRLQDRALFQCDSDSDDDGFLSLPKPRSGPTSGAEEPSAAAGDGPQPDPARENPPAGSGSPRPRGAGRSPEERRSSELRQRWPAEGGAFGWTGAAVKDGLSDEPRAEDPGRAGWESSAQIRALVEGMSFQKCQARVAEVWSEARGTQEEAAEPAASQLSLPVGPHRTGLSFCQTSPCEPTVTQRRHEVMKTVLTSKAFSTLGNRPATATDYLPFLRSVCRSERLKEQGKVKRRFLHYLDSIHLGLPKNTVQLLAADFP